MAKNSSNAMSRTTGELRSQWANPGDILSLLLLIGGDVIQKSIAQLVGCKIHLPMKKAPSLSVAPVALSFGWVAYAFSNLLSAVGDKRLMPIIWWLGWATILVQIGIAVPPWVLYGDWGIMMITLCGNLFAAITCALPQWTQEKWAGRKLGKVKVTWLTRGNGSLHIMVFIGSKGAWDLESLARGKSVPRPETRWISLALAILWTCLLISVSGLKENAWFLVAIGGIGMLQNVFAAGNAREPSTSNFHITPFERAPTIIGQRRDYDDDEDANVDLEADRKELADLDQWAPKKSKKHSSESPPQTAPMPKWLSSMSRDDGVPEWLKPIKPRRADSAANSSPWKCCGSENSRYNDIIYAVGVHGALMELEKWVPTAGLAMVQVFFPSGLSYDDPRIRDNLHKKFWKRAYDTHPIRRRAEEKRREMERQEEV